MFTIIGLLAIFASIYSEQYIPEYTKVTYVNDKYMYNCSANIKRYGRKSPYYFNIEGRVLHTCGNNVTLHLVFYEYQHYQYMRSFVEFHLKLCDMINHDPYIGKALKIILSKYSITCPLTPGMYRFNNITFPRIPKFLPFVKGKVEAIFEQVPSRDVILKVEILFHIKS